MNDEYLYNNVLIFTNFIKKYDNDMIKITSLLTSQLKNNKFVYHSNYILNIETEEKCYMPLVLLLGGNAYNIYHKIFSKYIDIPKYEEIIISSTDYDISILIKDDCDIKQCITIINDFINNNLWFFNIIKNEIKFEKINKDDIKNDNFLKTKKIINKDYNNYIITYTKTENYIGFQISIKFNNILFQIYEILFWLNSILNDNVFIQQFKQHNNILYINNDIKIILLHPVLLINMNTFSIESRFNKYYFEKCSKDYFRLLFLSNLINCKVNHNNLIIENLIFLIDKKFIKIYNKIFKFPFTICNLKISDEEKKHYISLYNKFINYDINKQLLFLNDFIK